MLKLKIKTKNIQYFYSNSSCSSLINFPADVLIFSEGSRAVKSVGVYHLKSLSFSFFKIHVCYSMLRLKATHREMGVLIFGFKCFHD